MKRTCLVLCVSLCFGAVALGQETVLVREGDTWDYFRGMEEPPFDWASTDFEPGVYGWESGPTGIGYADEDDATVLYDMQNTYVSVYMRIQFTVPSGLDNALWILRVRYDDGFVAYIDGQEIARRGLTGTPPLFNETAQDHEITAAQGFDEAISIQSAALSVPGDHVLAVQVHNSALDSSDLSFSAELAAISLDSVRMGLAFARGQRATAAGLGDVTSEGTFEVWFRGGAGGGFMRTRSVLATGVEGGVDDFRLELRGTQLRLRIPQGQQNVDLTGFATLDTTTWYHAAFTFTPGRRVLYLNGAVVGTDDFTMSINPAASLRLGDSFSNVGSFQGQVESVRVWSVERTAEEIRRLRYARFESADGLEGFWPLDEGAGQTSACLGPAGADFTLGAQATVDNADPQWAMLSDFPSLAVGDLEPMSGPLAGGSIVRIFGTGFPEDPVPEVRFGDKVSPAVTVVEPWELEAEVPAGSAYGAVDVVVFVGGSHFTLPAAYRYEPTELSTAVGEGDIWYYFIMQTPPPENWASPGFDPVAEGWASGPTGIGYADDDDATDVSGMMNVAVAVCARIEWNLPGDPADLAYLRLRVRYDDGFVAYLNGSEVARAGIDGWPPAFDALAENHEITVGAGQFDQEFDILASVDFLKSGMNVLGMEVHNTTLDSSDLSLSAELVYAFKDGPVVKTFIRGDVEPNQTLGITDAILILRYMLMGDTIECEESADTNDDGLLNIADPVFLLQFLFRGGRQPPPPYPNPGTDQDDDGIPCGSV